MRAVTFNAPRAIRVLDVADPVIEEPSDAVVRVVLAAICGSDLHPFRGHEVGLDGATIMGHEFIGKVVAVGQDVTTIALGDNVVAPFSTSCGACYFCVGGLTARCEEGQLFGWVQEGVGLHGGQAELVRVPLAETTLIPLPSSLELSVAGLFVGDILATGLYMATLGRIGPATSVAVVGCGPVGLMCMLAASEAGADRIWGIDQLPERLRLAAGLGAAPLDVAVDPASAIRGHTSGRGADVVIEAVGTAPATRLAYDLVRTGGVIVAAGVHTERALAVSPGELYDKNLTYRAGRCPARVFAEPALSIAERRRSDLESIVSHTMALEDAAAAYDLFDARRDGATKVILTP